MKVLVAGGAGFIGSNLIDALLTRGYEVICVDNLFIGTKKNIEHLSEEPRFTFVEEDICDLEALDKIFMNERIEYVFHLAANSDIQASANAPLIECKNTYLTTFNILECMRRNGVKKLFFASTSAVYGDKNGAHVAEDCPDLRPVSYYGGAKLGSEAMISSFSFMNDLSAMVFRFPNVIGPRLTHGVVFDFVKRLKDDPSKLRILGDGNQCKPYIYVSDLVEAIVRFMDAPQGVTCYNLGVETTTTVTKIAEITCEKMGLKNVEFQYTGGKSGWKGDVPVFQYNLKKIHSAGWYARHTSDEAVSLTVESMVK